MMHAIILELGKILQVSHLYFISLGLRLVLDFDLLVYAFGQIPLVVCTWICMFLSVLMVPYTLFHLWSQTQSGCYRHPRLCSLLFASLFLLYQGLGLGFLPTYVVVTNSFPPASCFIIILEQVDDQQGCTFRWLLNWVWEKKSCNSCRDHFIICLILGASNDESPLLCQGECTKSPDLGWRKDQYETFQVCFYSSLCIHVPFLFADSYDIFISDVFLMLIISSHSCHL